MTLMTRLTNRQIEARVYDAGLYTTENPQDAVWLLGDGTMLAATWQEGDRINDHREIFSLVDFERYDDHAGERVHYQLNAIRLVPESREILLSDEQLFNFSRMNPVVKTALKDLEDAGYDFDTYLNFDPIQVDINATEKMIQEYMPTMTVRGVSSELGGDDVEVILPQAPLDMRGELMRFSNHDYFMTRKLANFDYDAGPVSDILPEYFNDFVRINHDLFYELAQIQADVSKNDWQKAEQIMATGYEYGLDDPADYLSGFEKGATLKQWVDNIGSETTGVDETMANVEELYDYIREAQVENKSSLPLERLPETVRNMMGSMITAAELPVIEAEQHLLLYASQNNVVRMPSMASVNVALNQYASLPMYDDIEDQVYYPVDEDSGDVYKPDASEFLNNVLSQLQRELRGQSMPFTLEELVEYEEEQEMKK